MSVRCTATMSDEGITVRCFCEAGHTGRHRAADPRGTVEAPAFDWKWDEADERARAEIERQAQGISAAAAMLGLRDRVEALERVTKALEDKLKTLRQGELENLIAWWRAG